MMNYRPTEIIVDEEAIAHNLTCLKSKWQGKDIDIIAVVKANAYGHGDELVASAALQHGASALAVAIPEEAIKLRKHFKNEPIIILGPSVAQFATYAQAHNIRLTVPSIDALRALLPYVQSTGPALYIHIKVDSGMGRIGVRTLEEARAIEQEANEHNIEVEGIFTHFARADEKSEMTKHQLAFFRQIVQGLKKRPKVVHAANSAASILYESTYFDAVRFGISLYGIAPSEEVKEMSDFPWKPVLTLRSALSFVKKVPAGTPISYGSRYVTEKEEWIGTLPIGYADGLSRNLTGQEVLIDGQRAPIIGTICMDQCMIRLPKAYPVGETVTFIGKDGQDEIKVEEWSKRLKTIPYEVLTSLSDRISRRASGN